MEPSRGFITRQVSWWINVSGLVALTLIAIQLYFQRYWLTISTFVAMVLTHGILMVWHQQLDAMLDPEAMSVLDPERFAQLHESYEFVSGCHWLVAMIYLAAIVHGLSGPKKALAPPE